MLSTSVKPVTNFLSLLLPAYNCEVGEAYICHEACEQGGDQLWLSAFPWPLRSSLQIDVQTSQQAFLASSYSCMSQKMEITIEKNKKWSILQFSVFHMF